jgi:hypothetical protein
VDVAGWHLYLRDMSAAPGLKMSAALAQQLGPQAQQGSRGGVRESDVAALLGKIPVKLGAGKLQVGGRGGWGAGVGGRWGVVGCRWGAGGGRGWGAAGSAFWVRWPLYVAALLPGLLTGPMLPAQPRAGQLPWPLGALPRRRCPFWR